MQGPSHGTLLFGHFLDTNTLNEIADLTQRNIDIFAVGDPSHQVPGLPAPAMLKDQIFVRHQNPQFSIGYRYLNDPSGKPALILQVTHPRDLVMLGKSTALMFSGALLVLGLALFCGTYFFIRSFLKSRRADQQYLEGFRAVGLGFDERGNLLLSALEKHVGLWRRRDPPCSGRVVRSRPQG